MTTKLSNLFYAFLNIAASTQKLGINLIRVAILIIFVWIGGLKFYNYEAEGIVPFVANSPFMSFFYTKSAPEYKEYKLKEGEFNEAKHQWHVENNTYGFSHGLGILIMAIGILTFLGIFSPKIGLVGAGLAIIMTVGTLSFLVTTPEVWVPDLGSGEHGFPLLSGAGRLVIKDCIADAFLQNTLLIPEEYSVIATLNLNGDYVSDQLAAMVGGIGIAPGANINYQTGHAIFEATHGTAPNIAGKDVVNPCSIILSAVMMLEYFDWKEAAALIEKALEQSFLDARATHDLARFMPNGTSLSTSAFTREIVERIEKQK